MSRISRIIIFTSLAVLLLMLLSIPPFYHSKKVLADPAILSWSIVDTPAVDQPGNTIVTQSEVNTFTVATDEATLYATDIPNEHVYKSQDNGVSWLAYDEVGPKLVADGANLPAWNIATAPDQPAFIVAITDGDGTPNGPKQAFISTDEGNTWYNSNLTIGAGEFIGALDISPTYGGQGRDIAIGTRTGAGTGRVLILKLDNFTAGWQDQALTPVGDVVALKFSPNYTGDSTIVVTYADAPAAIGGTFLINGSHDLVNNTTTWGTAVEIRPSGASIGSSPDAIQIVTADLELPIDFV